MERSGWCSSLKCRKCTALPGFLRRPAAHRSLSAGQYHCFRCSPRPAGTPASNLCSNFLLRLIPSSALLDRVQAFTARSMAGAPRSTAKRCGFLLRCRCRCRRSKPPCSAHPCSLTPQPSLAPQQTYHGQRWQRTRAGQPAGRGSAQRRRAAAAGGTRVAAAARLLHAAQPVRPGRGGARNTAALCRAGCVAAGSWWVLRGVRVCPRARLG